MPTQPTKHYNTRGNEAVYDPSTDTCTVVVRGYSTPDGKIVERGGPAHPDDKPFLSFKAPHCSVMYTDASPRARVVWEMGDAVRDTFHDALNDRRDLLGAPVFRHKPADDEQRRYFAAAYDAAQKVRANSAAILGVNKVLFAYNPIVYTFADCFVRDKSGAFWLMFCASNDPDGRASRNLSLSAYILEKGEYVPAGATVRLGIWTFSSLGPRFAEIPNDRVAARDAVIMYLTATPF